MTDISPKLFQKVIKKGLTTTLFTAASTAALMLSSGGALGAAVGVTADVPALAVGPVIVGLDAPWLNNNSLVLMGGFDITTGEDGLKVAGVNVGVNGGQTFTVQNNGLTIVGKLDMNLDLTVGAGNTTVGSVGAGNVSVAAGVLNIGAADQNVTITGGVVNQTGAIGGALTVTNGGILAGDAGATDVAGVVTIQDGAGAVTMQDAAGTVTIDNAAPLAIRNAALGIDFVGNAAAATTVNVSDTGNVVDVDNTTGNASIGTLNFLGAGAANDIGANNALFAVNFNGAGAVKIAGASNATTFTIGNAGAVVTATGVMTGDVLFAAGGGTLTPTAGIAGDLTVSNGGIVTGGGDVSGVVAIQDGAGAVTIQDAINNGAAVEIDNGGPLTIRNAAGGIEFVGKAAAGTIVNVSNGGDVGDVDNTTGAASIGTLNFLGAGAANNIGATNALSAVNFNGAGAVKIAGTSNAATFTIGNAGAVVTATGVMTGNVLFAAGGGTLTPTAGIVGNLIVSNGGIVTGGGNVSGVVAIQDGGGAVVIQDATGNGGVTIGNGGPLTIRNAAGGINFAGKAAAGTIVNVSNGGDVGNVDNITGNVSIGTLNFLGGGAANNIGANNALFAVNFNGAGAVAIGGTSNAATFTIGNAAADVTANGLITGDVNFAADGKLTATNGIAGAVTAANGNGTLATAGNVTGAIGTNAASLKVLNVGVNNGGVIVLGSDVYADTVNFGDAGFIAANQVGEIQVGGNLIATTINFGTNVGVGNGGTLTFNGANAQDLKAIITNGANAVLNINGAGKVTASDASIGSVAVINIANNSAFAVDASTANITIGGAGNVINFKGANSGLTLSNLNGAAGNSVLLAGDLTSATANQGNLVFDGGANGLVIDSALPVAVKNIGKAGGNTFASLTINNSVTTTANINLANIPVLNISNGAVFADNGNTSTNIPQINIGSVAGAGTYVIDAQGGAVAIPNATVINFANAASNLILRNSSAVADGTITLNATVDPGAPNTGVLTIDSGNNARAITLAKGGAAASYGTVKNALQQLSFVGNGKFVINTPIFAASYDLSAASVTYGADIPGNLKFSGPTQLNLTGNINGGVDFQNNAATITLGAGNNILGGVTSTGGVNGTIIALGASTIAGPITGLAMLQVGAGAVSITNAGVNGAATIITEIQGNGPNVLTLPANFNLTGGINLKGGQPVGISFTNSGSVSGNAGTAANPIGAITTAGTTKFAGSVVAKGAATLGGTTSFANSFTNTGALNTGGTTTFTGAVTNTGVANFAGTTKFASTFNNQGAVTLAQNSINNFAGNVTATSFVANKATLNFSNNLAFNGGIIGSGTTINLGSSQLTYTGVSSFSGALNLNANYDPTVSTNGNIVIVAGSTVDLTQVSNLTLNITVPNNININNIAANTEYKIVSAQTSGGLTPAPAGNVNLNVLGGTNPFVRFTIDPTSLTLYVTDIARETVQQEITSGGILSNVPDSIKNDYLTLANSVKGSDGYEVLNMLGQLNPAQKVELIEDLTLNVVRTAESTNIVNTQAVIGNIASNLNALGARMTQTANVAAVAAGDESEEIGLGAWINPFVGHATQKTRKNISGYKSDSSGGTIGFDGMVGDDAILGLAYTRADTNIKLKNNKIGDKNKVNSNIYSVYGLYNLSDIGSFVEGVASYGDSRVKTRSQRIIAVAQNTTGYETASGKYKSLSYTGQIMVGYNYGLPETVSTMPVILTPLAGLRYSNIRDKGYTETGTTFQNLIVKGKNYNTFDGILGARLSSSINTGEVTLTPELYAMLDYGFKNKAPSIDARLQGMPGPFSTTDFKPSKTSFDLGAGLAIKHKMMEYGINYDVNIASKYFAQQGSLKVRVNF